MNEVKLRRAIDIAGWVLITYAVLFAKTDLVKAISSILAAVCFFIYGFLKFRHNKKQRNT